MVARTNIKTFACVLFFLLMATGALAACGGSSSTSSSGSSSASSGGSSASTSSTPAAGNHPNRVSGTITKYDSSAKTVTIIETDSTTATFSISNARILKSQKITQQQLGSLLSNSGTMVMVMGQKSGTTYTAQTIVVADRANGNGPRGGAGQGTQPNGTPPAGASQGGQMMGTPPAGAPQGQGGQNGNRVDVQNGKLQNDQLVGTDRQGQTVTVNLSGTTTILQQTVAAASDLQTGLRVTIVGAPAQSGSTADARQILIGDSSMM